MDILIERVRKRKSKPKTKHTKFGIPRTHPIRLQAAIQGSGGIVKVIAERLGVAYSTAYEALQNAPDYIQEDMRMEQERVADIAEQTIAEMMSQRIDFGTAARTARWLLERKYSNRGYQEKKEVTFQGGDNPLQFQNQVVLSVEKLKTIPLDVRRKMLEEMQDDES